MVREHECPRCGALTTGAYSEGGLRWAICDDCMRRERGEPPVAAGAEHGPSCVCPRCGRPDETHKEI